MFKRAQRQHHLPVGPALATRNARRQMAKRATPRRRTEPQLHAAVRRHAAFGVRKPDLDRGVGTRRRSCTRLVKVLFTNFLVTLCQKRANWVLPLHRGPRREARHSTARRGRQASRGAASQRSGGSDVQRAGHITARVGTTGAGHCWPGGVAPTAAGSTPSGPGEATSVAANVVPVPVSMMETDTSSRSVPPPYTAPCVGAASA